MYIPQLLYPFICQWHLGYFYVLTIAKKKKNVNMWRYLFKPVFSFLWQVPIFEGQYTLPRM